MSKMKVEFILNGASKFTKMVQLPQQEEVELNLAKINKILKEKNNASKKGVSTQNKQNKKGSKGKKGAVSKASKKSAQKQQQQQNQEDIYEEDDTTTQQENFPKPKRKSARKGKKGSKRQLSKGSLDDDVSNDEELDSQQLLNLENELEQELQEYNHEHSSHEDEEEFEERQSRPKRQKKTEFDDDELDDDQLEEEILRANNKKSQLLTKRQKNLLSHDTLEFSALPERGKKKRNDYSEEEDQLKRTEREEKRRAQMAQQQENQKWQVVDQILNDSGRKQKQRKEKEERELFNKMNHIYRSLPKDDIKIRYICNKNKHQIELSESLSSNVLLNAEYKQKFEQIIINNLNRRAYEKQEQIQKYLQDQKDLQKQKKQIDEEQKKTQKNKSSSNNNQKKRGNIIDSEEEDEENETEQNETQQIDLHDQEEQEKQIQLIREKIDEQYSLKRVDLEKQVEKELGISVKENGAIIYGFSDEDKQKMIEKYEKNKENIDSNLGKNQNQDQNIKQEQKINIECSQGCGKNFKYKIPKTNLKVCSLECYKAVQQNNVKK
ncbi:hypothetical protein PPERSA_07406 [Pseudocohnilembus persalinus]|uniref:INO80 complex subunit B-like conserved region domain-containing protein n=1 Tax=Pseudocohnilembus persalinus TaxID=266149 RepID=A0A0V0QAH0_PSEPJ|nr:hypothetical protein PPERSA_07406 [Pseudocohnilembus persalinus]|eukprot:KRW99163.1 hypothetical protein PPERSA_07406 [Pseudocohnilembus persalinus]